MRNLGVLAKLFRGLGDRSRLRVLAALRDGRLTAGEIVTRTKLSQPNASMHLACLAQCGLVTWEREGRFIYYQLADDCVTDVLEAGERLLLEVGGLIRACPRHRRARVSPGRRRAVAVGSA